MSKFRFFIQQLRNPFNYNIGFYNVTPESLIKSGELGRIQWLKHNYKDRYFADPFIYDVTENHIIVLVEELIFGGKGSIVELTVDRKTTKLIYRTEILKLDTHLSYPHIIRGDSKIYVMPENSASGVLKIYEYQNHKLINPRIVIDAPLNDSTIFADGDIFYLMGTYLKPSSCAGVFLFKSNNILGPYIPVGDKAVENSRSYSRPGGAFFKVGEKIYRVAQDCQGLYGNSLHIRNISSFEPYKESEVLHIKPCSYKYSKGLHTLNFHHSGIAVVDGNGFVYPTLARLVSPTISWLSRTIHRILD